MQTIVLAFKGANSDSFSLSLSIGIYESQKRLFVGMGTS